MERDAAVFYKNIERDDAAVFYKNICATRMEKQKRQSQSPPLAISGGQFGESFHSKAKAGPK